MKTRTHFIAVLMLTLVLAAHAEVPELRQKLPTEWWHMERIGAGKAGISSSSGDACPTSA